MSKVIEIDAIIEREIVYKEDSNWGMYGCVPIEEHQEIPKYNNYENVSVKGITHKLIEGQTYTLTLKEEFSKQWGYSYQILKVSQEAPKTEDDQKAYLMTILTENQVNAFYDAYAGQDVIELIKNDDIDVDKLNGIGKKSYVGIRNKVIENLEMMDALTYLSKYGVTYNAISSLVKEFNNSPKLLIQEIEENPYLLTRARGFGFKKVDVIALAMGYEKEGKHRLNSCIRYVIQEEQSNGHSYISVESLYRECKDLLGVDGKLIHEQFKKRIPDVFILEDKATLTRTYETEEYIANKLVEMQNNAKVRINIDIDKFLDEYEEKNEMKLTEQQRSFFHKFKENNVNFLIGYAGTGK